MTGGFLLFLRARRRDAYAGPEIDLFTPPEPASVPEAKRTPSPPPTTGQRPRAPPLPPPPVPPRSSGIISARLRPSLEIAVQPLRLRVDAETVVLEFELVLFNAGTVPARAVVAEASLFNAGTAQDEQLRAFFANPLGEGEPLDAIQPHKQAAFTSQVVASRSAVQEYEIAGRKAFVPVIAFNALYRWTGGEAQTSTAFLIGRETKREKLGPLHFEGDQGELHGLAAKELAVSLRT